MTDNLWGENLRVAQKGQLKRFSPILGVEVIVIMKFSRDC